MIKDHPSTISYFIPDYSQYNKLILFHLLGKGIIKPDETFLNEYLNDINQISKNKATDTKNIPIQIILFVS